MGHIICEITSNIQKNQPMKLSILGMIKNNSIRDSLFNWSNIRKRKEDIRIKFIPEEEIYGLKDIRRRIPDLKAKEILNYQPKISLNEAHKCALMKYPKIKIKNKKHNIDYKKKSLRFY